MAQPKQRRKCWHSYNILWKILLKLVYFTFPFTVFLNFQVLYQWNNKNLVTVRNLMTEMVAWQRNIYLDPGIWEYFQSRMNPAVLPDDISALQLARPTGQSAVLSYMVNIFAKFININNY